MSRSRQLLESNLLGCYPVKSELQSTGWRRIISDTRTAEVEALLSNEDPVLYEQDEHLGVECLWAPYPYERYKDPRERNVIVDPRLPVRIRTNNEHKWKRKYNPNAVYPPVWERY